MADNIETVSVEGAAQNRRPKYPGLSALQAGLLYGGAAAAVAGPLAIPVGLLAGIVAGRQKRTFLDSEAATVENIQSEHQALLDRIAKEYAGADPDEQRQLDQARDLASDGYRRLMSGDTSGDQLLAQSRALSLGIVGADMQARKADEAAAMAFQRQLIGDAAKSYRDSYQKTLEDHDTIQSRTGRIFDLLSQADFDPNKPVYKAAIGDLIMDGMGMYRDTPDAWDAISRGAGAFSGIAAAAVDGLAALMKSEDFKISREDYYRIALNLRQFADQQSQGRIGQLGGQAKQLDEFARRTRSIPDNYSLGDYVSGGVKELRLLPVPPVAPTPAGVIERAASSVTGQPSSQPTAQIGTRRLGRSQFLNRAPRPVN